VQCERCAHEAATDGVVHLSWLRGSALGSPGPWGSHDVPSSPNGGTPIALVTVLSLWPAL